MSDPSETSGRPLASSIQQQREGATISPLTSPPPHHRRTSHSSDERTTDTKSTTSRRRPGTRKETTLGPKNPPSHLDSATMQRSTSPSQMSPDSSVHYTRTGRISKAKKGLKVHHCECGRVSATQYGVHLFGCVPLRLVTHDATTPCVRVAPSYTKPPSRHYHLIALLAPPISFFTWEAIH